MKTQLITDGQQTKSAQHTPGPWQYNCCQIIGPVQSARNGKAQPGVAIAHIYDRLQLGWHESSPIPTTSEREAEANARLIAASPAMFDYIKAKAGAGDTYAAEIIASIIR